MKKLRLFWNLPPAGKWIFIEVFVLSIYTTILLQRDKGNVKVMSLLKQQPAKSNAGRSTDTRRQKTVQLASSAIQTVAHYTPWKNICYHQALQARFLLNRRGIPTQVYIGVKRNEQGEISGHAWTMCADRMITGFCKPDEYVILSEFQ